MIKVTCYGQVKKFENAKEAIKFFRNAYFASEGSEQERYSRILMQLYEGKTECSDREGLI